MQVLAGAWGAIGVVAFVQYSGARPNALATGSNPGVGSEINKKGKAL